MLERSDVPEPFLVVAYEGSPTARNAAAIAIQIAQSQQLQIHGLYVVDATLALDLYTDYQAELGSTWDCLAHGNRPVFE